MSMIFSSCRAQKRLLYAQLVYQCSYEGYKRRMGIYEVVNVDDELRRMIHNGSSELDMESHALQSTTGIRMMRGTKNIENYR